MKKTAALFLALTLVLSGCAAPVAVKPGAMNVDLMADFKMRQVTITKPAADAAAFALNFLKTTYDGKNTVVSPASAYLALSMAANGASGDTLKEFENVLGASAADLNAVCKTLMDPLNCVYEGVKLKTVNGIWYNTAADFKPNRTFLQTNADYFGAAEIASDFSKRETLDDINGFVSDNTNKLIPGILDQLDPGAVMVLVNTLYFNGKWQAPFDPEKTNTGKFKLSDGSGAVVPMMNQTYDKVGYFENADAKGIILPYQFDRFAYVAVLPSGDVSPYLSALTPDGFKALIASTSDEKVELSMPKYDVTGDYKLVDILETMGLKLAFDPDRADFSAIGTAKNNIFISDAVQKVVFKLGEKGTEAAAATGIMMTGSAAPLDRPILLQLNRPFIYALMDMETNTPLFMGVLDNPKSAE
jgi:serine protease inhibitor